MSDGQPEQAPVGEHVDEVVEIHHAIAVDITFNGRVVTDIPNHAKVIDASFHHTGQNVVITNGEPELHARRGREVLADHKLGAEPATTSVRRTKGFQGVPRGAISGPLHHQGIGSRVGTIGVVQPAGVGQDRALEAEIKGRRRQNRVAAVDITVASVG